MVFTFIDLFSGIGGIRLGFDKYGGVCVFSSEIDKFACITYKKNFREYPSGDITELLIDDIPDHEILTAGFPCQPFSLSGVVKRESLNRPHGFDCIEKGHLIFKIIEILKIKQPKAFFLENVKNLKSHNKGQTFKTILKLLEEVGYTVFSKIIDACAIVPQHRERLYIIGFREDLGIDFKFPSIPNTNPKLKYILDDVVDPKYTLSDKMWNYLISYKEKHRKKGNGFGYGLGQKEGISRTLQARYYKDGSEILIPQTGKNPRKLTPRECARLMGFPDTFKIPVSNTQAYKQFGNSVVVPLVELIAWSMVECLFRNNVLSPLTSLFEGSEKSREPCSDGEETTMLASPGETPQIASTP